jgi:hypothetical protein
MDRLVPSNAVQDLALSVDAVDSAVIGAAACMPARQMFTTMTGSFMENFLYRREMGLHVPQGHA